MFKPKKQLILFHGTSGLLYKWYSEDLHLHFSGDHGFIIGLEKNTSFGNMTTFIEILC